MTERPPIPFEIVQHPSGARVASDGTLSLLVLYDAADARVFRRRSVSGLPIKPPAELLVPQLNQFAGELLADPHTTAQAARDRLIAIAGMVAVAEPVRSESLVVEIDGVRVYFANGSVIVTRQDLGA
jgi:hypothetical protein